MGKLETFDTDDVEQAIKLCRSGIKRNLIVSLSIDGKEKTVETLADVKAAFREDDNDK